jgi:signal transduction histidine kinase
MKPESPSFRTGRWFITFAALTAATGVGLSLFIHARMVESETAAARLSADTLRQHTEQELNLFTDVLESVRALHALSGEISQAAMDEFIEKGLVHQHAVLGAFGLVQQISPQLRTAIESKETSGPGAYKIVQKGRDGNWVPAASRPVYYPLTWQSRTGALNIPIGFDFGSAEENRNVIVHIQRTRRTEMIPVPISGTPGPAYWVLAPVIPRDAPGFVIGFAVAVLHPQEILDKVTALSVESPALSLKPADRTIEENIRFTRQGWKMRLPLRAVGTEWVFECALPAPAAERRSTAALIFGLVVTGLMASLLVILAGRTRRIETEVLDRTEDLRIANSRLEQNIRERAQMEEEMNELSAREQRRIGRDLHDSLGQKLTGAVFLSRSLLNHFKQTGSEQQTHARTLNETLKSAVGQVRNMARGLASVTLNEESLEESLEQLADEMASLYNTSCAVERKAPLPGLDRKTKEQLYFIAREAVNNAARHARPERITIQLEGSESGWTLRVIDDGTGLPEGTPGGEGMGLRIMRHRATRIGASFEIRSTPGQGTVIEVTGDA